MSDRSVLLMTMEEKIREAQDLMGTCGEELLADQSVAGMLEQLRENAAFSQQAMWELGVVECCTECETEEGGSCCGAGIENRYTPTLLLINLLLSVPLPRERKWENSCFFLGEKGCTLIARDILCINYLCRKIHDRLSLSKIIRLQGITGQEMDCGFLVHENVKRFILNNQTRRIP